MASLEPRLLEPVSEPQAWQPSHLWLVAAYPLAWAGLFALSSIFWFLPAGLRLATLWVLPRRAWWLMALAEWAVILLLGVLREGFTSWGALLAATLLPWGICALVLRAIGRHGRDTPAREALPRLLLVGLVAATFTAVLLTGIELMSLGSLPTGLTTRLVSYGLGDFAGVVMLLPLLLALREQWLPERLPWLDWCAHGLVLAPVAIALALVTLAHTEAPVYPLLLAMLPLIALAYRFGWRQAAVAMSLLAIGMQVVTEPLGHLWKPGQPQLLVTLGSLAAILLGVAAETQRVNRRVLSATVAALSLRGNQLVEAANRIATLQEQERRRIGVELHDQLGQDMTAIATRLRVVERTARDPQVREGLASIGDLLTSAHGHLREVINQLHPAVLDRFGLSRALAEGPFAEMLRDHEIDYSCEVHGDVDSLPDNIASAIYRICQEAATNCSRHGCGGQMHIWLTLTPAVAHGVPAELTLQIDDGAGRLQIDPGRPGRGLLNIRDRADAIGADYQFHADCGSPRHSLRLQGPYRIGGID